MRERFGGLSLWDKLRERNAKSWEGEAETGLRLWEGDERVPLDGRSWTTDGQNLGRVLSEEIRFHPDVSF